MTSQSNTWSGLDWFDNWVHRRNFCVDFAKLWLASGFARLLSLEGKLLSTFVLLLGSLYILGGVLMVSSHMAMGSLKNFALQAQLSKALWSQTWLRKATHEFALIGSVTKYIDAIFCEAMPGFAKLMSPEVKLWIVVLLLWALHMVGACTGVVYYFNSKHSNPSKGGPSKSCRFCNLPFRHSSLAEPKVAWRNDSWVMTLVISLIYPLIEADNCDVANDAKVLVLYKYKKWRQVAEPATSAWDPS